MKKIILGLFASWSFAFAFDFSEITCDSFDVKVKLITDAEILLPSEIAALYNGEYVYILDAAGRPGFGITKDGFYEEYSSSVDSSRVTHTNMKKESEKNNIITCSMIVASDSWDKYSETEQTETKKVYYTISNDEDKGERLIVKVKE